MKVKCNQYFFDYFYIYVGTVKGLCDKLRFLRGRAVESLPLLSSIYSLSSIEDPGLCWCAGIMTLLTNTHSKSGCLVKYFNELQ